ncbi:unnamed protein product [marine sediment metagenome]|uniref:HTH cro/C1-type domain-containing protein n=1 Tax=marine sediment metagenome TaxID=412755 RepID=X0Z715_9ZZZZ
MTNEQGIDLTLIKKQLTGANLKKLLLKKNVTKYRLAKDCGINYRTIMYWQRESNEPSDELAMRVGQYLGLIPAGEVKKEELQRRLSEIEKEIGRLK